METCFCHTILSNCEFILQIFKSHDNNCEKNLQTKKVITTFSRHSEFFCNSELIPQNPEKKKQSELTDINSKFKNNNNNFSFLSQNCDFFQ